MLKDRLFLAFLIYIFPAIFVAFIGIHLWISCLIYIAWWMLCYKVIAPFIIKKFSKPQNDDFV